MLPGIPGCSTFGRGNLVKTTLLEKTFLTNPYRSLEESGIRMAETKPSCKKNPASIAAGSKMDSN